MSLKQKKEQGNKIPDTSVEFTKNIAHSYPSCFHNNTFTDYKVFVYLHFMK